MLIFFKVCQQISFQTTTPVLCSFLKLNIRYISQGLLESLKKHQARSFNHQHFRSQKIFVAFFKYFGQLSCNPTVNYQGQFWATYHSPKHLITLQSAIENAPQQEITVNCELWNGNSYSMKMEIQSRQKVIVNWFWKN